MRFQQAWFAATQASHFGGTGKAVTMSQIAYQGFQPLGALLHKTDLQLKFQNRSLESLQKLRLY